MTGLQWTHRPDVKHFYMNNLAVDSCKHNLITGGMLQHNLVNRATFLNLSNYQTPDTGFILLPVQLKDHRI